MPGDSVRIPDADHPITIERNARRVTVTAGGEVIADTRSALTLREASYPAVQYLPRKDVDMSRLERTARRSHCPYKGEASYFTIAGASGRSENAAWSYEAPHEAVAAIGSHLAFYPDRVDGISESV